MSEETPAEKPVKEKKPAAPAAPVISANPAKVEWPTDQWGFTRELRAAGLKAAQGVRGDEQKLAIFMETIRVLVMHMKARMPVDVEHRAVVLERREQIAKATARVYGNPSPKPGA
jgi:hypothetical protein